VTGCTAALEAGATYILEAHITGTATANGGAKATFAASGVGLTATSISFTGQNWNGTTLNALATATSLGSAVASAAAILTDIYMTGVIVVNAAGTIALQFAQNTSHADTSSAYVNSWMKATRIA